MTSLYLGRGLPVELMSMILDNVDISSLMQLSHASRRWHAVARSHPSFWRMIRLASVSTTALDFFQARLDQTQSPDIHIEIILPDALERGRIRSVVLPALARNLHRLTQLHVKFHYDMGPYALSAFMGPAPRLQSLSLIFSHGAEKPPIALPPGFLAGGCPRLVDVTLRNLAFPTDCITSFCHVQSLLFGCDGPYLFPLGLFQHFPTLHTLWIRGGTCLGAEPSDEAASKVSALSLATLEVHLARCNHLALFRAIPHLASIPTVVCREPHVLLMRTLLDQLHGPLEFEVVVPPDAAELVDVGFISPQTSRARVFVEHAERIQREWPRDIVFAPDIVARVTSLRFEASLAYLVPSFKALPSCATLAVEVGDAEELAAPLEAALPLPALKTVVVRATPSRSPVVVPAEALRGFLARLVGTRADQPTLRIEGSLTLSGDRAALMQDYGVPKSAA